MNYTIWTLRENCVYIRTIFIAVYICQKLTVNHVYAREDVTSMFIAINKEVLRMISWHYIYIY